MENQLDPLPKSASKYFTKYGANTFKTELKELPKCDHVFKLVKAQETECVKCHMGLFLSPKDKVKDGHIYRNGKLVI